MGGLCKFLAGAVATGLLAAAAHSLWGSNAAFVDTLESRAKVALGNAGGGVFRLTMERSPALNRVALISGSADKATQARLLAAVRAVPGIKDARWIETPAAVPLAEEAATPVTEK